MATRARSRLKTPNPLLDGPTEAENLERALEVCAMFGLDVGRQNTGAAMNPMGQTVRFGVKGNSDITGMIPWRNGCKVDIEIKRFGFRPWRCRSKKERERFETQLARLRKTNEGNGVGLWIDDAAVLPHVFQRLKEGYRVEIGRDGLPWLTDDGEAD